MPFQLRSRQSSTVRTISCTSSIVLRYSINNSEQPLIESRAMAYPVNAWWTSKTIPSERQASTVSGLHSVGLGDPLRSDHHIRLLLLEPSNPSPGPVRFSTYQASQHDLKSKGEPSSQRCHIAGAIRQRRTLFGQIKSPYPCSQPS